MRCTGIQNTAARKTTRMWTRRPRSKSLESQCIPVDLASMTTKACLYLVALRLQHPPEVATLGREGRKKHEHATKYAQLGGSLTALILRAISSHPFTLLGPNVPHVHRHVATCPDAGKRRHRPAPYLYYYCLPRMSPQEDAMWRWAAMPTVHRHRATGAVQVCKTCS